MLLFDFTDFSEQESDLRETFFFRGFSEFRIHRGPFVVFAVSCHFQMFSGGFLQIPYQPEPQFCMSSFVSAGFAEQVSDLARNGRILFCFLSEQVVLHMSLGFTGKSSAQILLGLSAGQSLHFFQYFCFFHCLILLKLYSTMNFPHN